MRRIRHDAIAGLIGATLAFTISLLLAISGFVIFPYQAQSVCDSHPCRAVGVIVLLPNLDRIDIAIMGPGAPGADYAPAGSPSNYEAR